MKGYIEYSVSIRMADNEKHCPYELFSSSFAVNDVEKLTADDIKSLIESRLANDMYNKSNLILSDLKLDNDFASITIFGVSVKTYVDAGFVIKGKSYEDDGNW